MLGQCSSLAYLDLTCNCIGDHGLEVVKAVDTWATIDADEEKLMEEEDEEGEEHEDEYGGEEADLEGEDLI